MSNKSFLRIIISLQLILMLFSCGCDGLASRPNVALRRIFRELPAPLAIESQAFDEKISKYTRTKRISGNKVNLLFNGEQVFSCLFADIRGAKKEILISTYVFFSDDFGTRLADLLIEKSNQGLDVKFIYDSFGSTYFRNPLTISRMRKAGIVVRAINPALGITILRANNRGHAKLVVIDEEISYVMGLNFSKKYVGGGLTRRKWRDNCIRTVGPIALDVKDVFLHLLGESGRGLVGKRVPLPFVDLCVEGIGKALGHDYHWPPDYSHDDRLSRDSSGIAVRVVFDRPGWFSLELYNSLLLAIQSSTISIDIECGYFMPDMAITKALLDAAQRGVKIRIILPDRLDVYLSKKCSLEASKGLFKRGIRLYAYTKGLLHAKTVVIDGVWLFLGSTNINGRSFLLNYECNLEILDRNLCSQFKKQFDFDVLNSRMLTERDLRYVNPFQYFSHRALLLLKDHL